MTEGMPFVSLIVSHHVLAFLLAIFYFLSVVFPVFVADLFLESQ